MATGLQTAALMYIISRPIDAVGAKTINALLDPDEGVVDKRCAALAVLPRKNRLSCVIHCKYLLVPVSFFFAQK